MRIKRFLEMSQQSYNYDRIIRILHKSHGWGQGVYYLIKDFENNKDYFIDPIDDNDYVEQFHIFLTDKECGRLRGELNQNYSLRTGNWKLGIPVKKPTNIYNKLI